MKRKRKLVISLIKDNRLGAASTGMECIGALVFTLAWASAAPRQQKKKHLGHLGVLLGQWRNRFIHYQENIYSVTVPFRFLAWICIPDIDIELPYVRHSLIIDCL